MVLGGFWVALVLSLGGRGVAALTKAPRRTQEAPQRPPNYAKTMQKQLFFIRFRENSLSAAKAAQDAPKEAQEAARTAGAGQARPKSRQAKGRPGSPRTGGQGAAQAQEPPGASKWPSEGPT